VSTKAKFGPGSYKTRCGEDVEIVAVVGKVAIGYSNNNPKAANTWSAHTGRFHFGLSYESKYDLIDANANQPESEGLKIGLRDWFAGQASDSDVKRWKEIYSHNGTSITEEEAKYVYADAMIAARGKQEGGEA